MAQSKKLVKAKKVEKKQTLTVLVPGPNQTRKF
jgi:hypothetical protein